MFKEFKIKIKSSINKDNICVLYTRGKCARVKELKKLLPNSNDHKDAQHEVDFMKRILEKEVQNDVAITIPASIIIYDKTQKNEFDGLIIYPNRSKNQIVFLEAKNKKCNRQEAKKELYEKIKNYELEMNKADINMDRVDAYENYTIKLNR